MNEPLTEALRAAASPTRLPTAAHLRMIVSVFKPRIALEIMLTAVAGMAVTQGTTLNAAQLLLVAVAVFLAAAAAGAYNQLSERDIDARMLRTRKRPFVTGEVVASGRWYAGIALLLSVAIGLAVVASNALAALYILLGALTYGVIYTQWLKRRTSLNIVVGGLAGSFAALAGSAAANATLPASAWWFALAVFFWTPPHFWSLALYNKQDYLAASVPMLPTQVSDRVTAAIVLAHTLLLVALTVLPSMLALGPIYSVCAIAGGAYFIKTSVQLALAPTRAAALKNFHASLWQLGLLLLGAIANAIYTGQLLAL